MRLIVSGSEVAGLSRGSGAVADIDSTFENGAFDVFDVFHGGSDREGRETGE